MRTPLTASSVSHSFFARFAKFVNFLGVQIPYSEFSPFLEEKPLRAVFFGQSPISAPTVVFRGRSRLGERCSSRAKPFIFQYHNISFRQKSTSFSREKDSLPFLLPMEQASRRGRFFPRRFNIAPPAAKTDEKTEKPRKQTSATNKGRNGNRKKRPSPRRQSKQSKKTNFVPLFSSGFFLPFPEKNFFRRSKTIQKDNNLALLPKPKKTGAARWASMTSIASSEQTPLLNARNKNDPKQTESQWRTAY